MPGNVDERTESEGDVHPHRTTQDLTLRQLEDSQAILAAAQRLANFRGWTYDVPSRTLEWCSDGGSALVFRPEELLDLSRSRFFERIHPQDRQALAALVQEVLAHGRRTVTFNYRFLSAAGKQKRIVGNGEALLGPDGRVRRVVGGLMDVSTSPGWERQARDRRIRALGESSSVWIWEQDAQFRFTSLSRTRDEKLSAQHASMIGKSRWEVPGAEACSGTWESHRKILAQQLSFHDFEYRVRLAGGEERVFSATGAPAYAADGQFIGYHGTAWDVTPLKVAQERASQSQALLRLASRLGRVGGWTIDLASMEGSWSRELLDLYEFEPGQRLTIDLLVGLAAADQRDGIRLALRACRTQGSPVDLEFASITAKGSYVWLRLTAEAVRDRSGAVVRMQGAVQDITDRKRDAERLRAINQQLTTTFESISDGFITVDRQLRFTYVNQEAERRSGLSRSVLLGVSLTERFPRLMDSQFGREFSRALAEGTPGTVEAYSNTFRLWLSVTVYPSEQGLTLYFRDVTESKKAQQQLVLSEERYRLLFETSADGILRVHPGGRIAHANQAACGMFGRTEAQMRKMLSRKLVSSADGRLEPIVRQWLQTGRTRGELTMERADGSTFEADVNASTFKDARGSTFVNVVIRDATERIQLRQRLIALNEELAEKVRQRTRELEQANTELRAFARSLAHDLRQPIAAAKAFGFALEAALSRGDAKNAEQFATKINETSEWAGNYVEGLLSLTKISQAVLAMEEVDLSALAEGLLHELQEQQPGRRALVTVQPGLSARGDRTLLRLLLQNLLGNAWKFTGRKDLTRIAFARTFDEDAEVVYSVEDNGAGFDVSQAERLFDTFQRFHRETEFSGMGIGLANARKIVERHGGRIWAESQPNRGAKFLFTLGARSQARAG